MRVTRATMVLSSGLMMVRAVILGSLYGGYGTKEERKKIIKIKKDDMLHTSLGIPLFVSVSRHRVYDVGACSHVA